MIRRYEILKSEKEKERGDKLWFNLMAYEINDKLFHIEHSLKKHVYKENQEAKISNYNYGGSLAIVVVHVSVERHAIVVNGGNGNENNDRTKTEPIKRCSRYKDKI